MKRLSALAALVMTLALPAAPALAREFVNDGASMFSASTVSALNSRISNFNAQTGKEVVVVTVPSLGGQTTRDAAEKEFAQRQVNGVLIYIAKDDRKDIIVPDAAGVRAGWFSTGTLDPIRQGMEAQFKDSDFDGGITTAVSGVLGIYRSHVGSLNRNTSTNSVPVTQTRPYSNAASSGGFHLNMFWIIIIIVAGFLVIRSLMRAMSAPRPPMMQGGAPGAPGYGPGMGYGPGGYGGGGGSFFSGLLGGLGGAFLGNELFGNRGGGGGIGGGESGGGYGAADTSGASGAQDPGGWGSDAGQADMGGSSGGDFSGGGFGGGDSGGGFGGGDFGGGGGGDSGGGW